jgi:hypothetical protein
LSETSSEIVALREQNEVGSGEFKEFLETSKIANEDKSPSSEGTLPPRPLPLMAMKVKDEAEPSCDGMDPVKRLFFRYSRAKFGSEPSMGGIFPVSFAFVMMSEVRPVKAPRAAGSEPPKLPEASTSCRLTRESMRPIEPGMTPPPRLTWLMVSAVTR